MFLLLVVPVSAVAARSLDLYPMVCEAGVPNTMGTIDYLLPRTWLKLSSITVFDGTDANSFNRLCPNDFVFRLDMIYVDETQPREPSIVIQVTIVILQGDSNLCDQTARYYMTQVADGSYPFDKIIMTSHPCYSFLLYDSCSCCPSAAYAEYAVDMVKKLLECLKNCDLDSMKYLLQNATQLHLASPNTAGNCSTAPISLFDQYCPTFQSVNKNFKRSLLEPCFYVWYERKNVLLLLKFVEGALRAYAWFLPLFTSIVTHTNMPDIVIRE